MIGAILDDLPANTAAKDKPSLEDINRFKSYLSDESNHSKTLQVATDDDTAAAYMITGSVSDYKRGSGVTRLFIGFGVGDAKITTTLTLVDRKTKAIIFAGEFSGKVADWKISGDKMFKEVAKDFAKQLRKQNAKLLKNQNRD